MIDEIIAALRHEGAPLSDTEGMRRFFKVQPGGYGAGDEFLGINVPAIRRVAKHYRELPMTAIDQLLDNPYHEVRLLAVIILANRCHRADEATHRAIYDFYLRNAPRMNGWDIVDSSCYHIVGSYIVRHPDEWPVLERLSRSDNLWERRIAIVSTWALIRAGQLAVTFTIADQLLDDKQDLIHKAVGWMLREAGKRDRERLRTFIMSHGSRMSRTTLRYAIEHFDQSERAHFLASTRTK